MAERRGRSLRGRITLVSTAIVAVTLVIGAILFVLVLRTVLIAEVGTAAERDLQQVESEYALDGALNGFDPDDDEILVQVTDDSGALLAGSDALEGQAVPLDDTDDAQLVRVPDEDAAYLVAAEEQDGLTIAVGRSVETVDESVGTVGWLLAGAVPLLVLVVAALTWIVVGRALAPVERMRREVDAVTASSLDRRIKDPGRADEIGRLAHTMNGMLDRLEQSQHAQRQFVSDASHELRSPLASLRQYAEVAQAHPDRVNLDDLSEAVLDEGARLERLVRGMLLLAQVTERSATATGTAVDLDDLMLAEARRLRDTMALGIDSTGVGAARVHGDETLLGQVVRNLVDNAAQHASGRVTLALGVVDGQALLVVEDDGHGVPPGERERVFERFVRLDESRARASGGTGLGLAIVRESVAAHHGTVRIVDSELGGARFEVRLPAET
ncbi:HAMP domain-containing protein [Cryobacterium sp. 1639]|uniref:sensor histidine kinase n=1 Tax=Cryobacterium inferilacus TaxID=2866629 RepID=UPI001C7334C5|nr:ATP-binding protein [Cryobacterium sp. 1639]MBX0301286.1 HAMP domain-containing protein [Cryobacterium sp. 1639]